MHLEVLPLTLALFMLPGSSNLKPMDVGFGLSGVVIDEVVGNDEPLVEGGLVTFHYEIREVGGKVLADSERRGLSYRGVLAEDGPDAIFIDALEGIRVGGTRRIFTDTDSLQVSTDGTLPAGTPLSILVRVLAIENRQRRTEVRAKE